jgi:hypothetical protein
MGRPKKVQAPIAIDEVEDLRNKVAELTKLLESKGVSLESQEEENVEINRDAYIKVISLCPVTLNLSTLGMGKGKVFTFTKFGEVKRILYTDLVDIMERHANFLTDGLFYIADKKVVRRHGLDDAYASILTKEKIEEIMSGKDFKESLALFESANNAQKGIIVDHLISKIANGAEMDLNLIASISKITKVDITAKAEEVKFYLNKQ